MLCGEQSTCRSLSPRLMFSPRSSNQELRTEPLSQGTLVGVRWRRTATPLVIRISAIREGLVSCPKSVVVGVGESLVGDGNEVAHIDLLIGPRGSAVETAFCNALTNNKDGFTTLLAVVAPNLLCKPPTILYNKVTIKDARQAVQMFGPAQYAVAKAVADSVAEGMIPANEADDLYITVGVFIHWEAKDDKKIQDFNYRATKEAIARAVKGEPKASEVTVEEGLRSPPVRSRLKGRTPRSGATR